MVQSEATYARGTQGWVAQLVYPVIGIVLTFGMWAIAAESEILSSRVLPSPSDVLIALTARPSFFAAHIWSTLQATIISFIACGVIGVLLGTLIAGSRFLERTLYPVLVSTQVVPKIAIGPAILIWLGFGITAKAGVGFLIAFFPVLIATVVGLQGVEIEKLYLVRSMGAGTIREFFLVRLPTALPEIFAGLKLAMAFSVTGVVIGEFIGSEAGLGRVVIGASGVQDTSTMFGALFLLGLIGIALFSVVAGAERVFLRWHRQERE